MVVVVRVVVVMVVVVMVVVRVVVVLLRDDTSEPTLAMGRMDVRNYNKTTQSVTSVINLWVEVFLD